MTNWLKEYINRGNVIIFKNGIGAELGSYDFEVNKYHNGQRFNIYVGARGQWVNKGDGGWINWAMMGHYDKVGNVVRFH